MERWREPATVAEAEVVQREIAARVEIPTGPVPPPRRVAGLDISYRKDSDLVAAAAVVVDVGTLEAVEEVVVDGEVGFPYVPGLLAFREIPMLLRVLDALRTPVDLLLCDGQGLAHPRRCGVACHLGVVTGLPAVGCAKNHLVGEHDEPGPARGERAALVEGGDVLGCVLRTQDGVRPVYVSPGHRIGVDQACDVVLGLCTEFRLPDPVRRADHISRRALK
ncbi:endonuclease V [Pseudonocardia humida]|uniref:endonuclease V n=1 Tax=Pseudonocardia humida TaxID=2800819 RepID=UPI00207C8BBC|nr:endonuclease V [Pseudonocardia humida]